MFMFMFFHPVIPPIGIICFLSRHFFPNSEKLVPSIPARDYTEVAMGRRKLYAKSESGAYLVMNDVNACYDVVVYRVKTPGIHFQYQNEAQ
jgi:hypothetical protein